MPEGNEIHRWAERHQAAFGGKIVRADGPQGRFTDVTAIDGRKLLRVMAVGKHLGYVFGKDRILHIHLGLQGDFTDGSGPLPEVRGALRLRMWNAAAIKKPVAPGESRRHAWYSDDDGTGNIDAKRVAWVELRGPMDCSIYTDAKWDKLRERLGPDPLGVDGKGGDDPARAFAKILKSKKAIGALLMDQSVIAGIGNIYRAELLFRAKLSPFVAGKDVPEQTLKAIWKDALPLMRAGMVDRRIVTTILRDRPSSHGKNTKKRPDKTEVHYVYRRNGHPLLPLRDDGAETGDGRPESLLVPCLSGRLKCMVVVLMPNVSSLYRLRLRYERLGETITRLAQSFSIQSITCRVLK